MVSFIWALPLTSTEAKVNDFNRTRYSTWATCKRAEIATRTVIEPIINAGAFSRRISVFRLLTSPEKIRIYGSIPTVSNAIKLLQACIYRSVNTGLFLTSLVATNIAKFMLLMLDS